MAYARASRLCRRLFWSAAIAAAVFASAPVRAEAPSPPSGVEIQQELKSFSQMATVLHVAAHPDDENTNLITYLARGRGYRAAYLSINRGDGGQNLLGGEFGAELGYIRTNELLAARQLDHGMQFFTRAIDFGYSKSPDETLRIWDHQKVLEDVVRVIRTFRPDVIVTRFSPQTQQGQHGHHTASAILAIEAFKVAGDPKVLPDVPVWQPKRILQNGGGGVSMASGGTDPVLNLTYGAIAGQSRAMHKSQGFGNAGGGGGGRGGGNPQESFSLLGGEPATTDIMDGIDTTWGRVGKGGDEIAKLTDDAIAKFDPQKPEASVAALLEIKKRVVPFLADPIVAERRRKLDRIIADCVGLSVETTVPNAEVIPGEVLPLHHAATLRTNVPVTWMGVRYPVTKGEVKPGGDGVVLMKLPQTATRDSTPTLPSTTPVSQPYWLRQEPAAGIYTVADASLIGRPENPPAFPVELFEIGGQNVVISDSPVQLIANASPAQARRRLDVVAPVSLAFPSEVRVFAPGAAKTVDVDVTAHKAGAAGSVKLKVPPDWKVTPDSQNFSLAAVGDHKTFTFTVTPPAKAAEATFSATATIGTQTFDTGWKEIAYEHLPRLLLQPPATIRAVALDLKIAGKTVGYLPGAGDSVDECLRQMGYTVKELSDKDLTENGLKGFDAVVVGVRAFNTRPDLAGGSATLKALFDYAANGGTLVAQYNRQGTFSPGPFAMTLSALRVTDENAEVKFLVPDSPVLNTPNKISQADFANWVQERNIYLPQNVDPAFSQVLGMADPGETPPNTSLLVAKTGKGYFVYTSLVFFRELPAGNPGAYRLFANLVSLGKQ